MRSLAVKECTCYDKANLHAARGNKEDGVFRTESYSVISANVVSNVYQYLTINFS